MSKIVQPVVFLITIYTTTANATEFYIYVNLIGPRSPTHIVLTDKYCIDSVDDIIKLNEGHAKFTIDTKSGLFSECGWVHSSATFEVRNSEETRLLEFEFYKDIAMRAYLEVNFRLKRSTCFFSHDIVERSLSLKCNQL